MNKQDDLIKNMTDKELSKHVFVSQLLLLILGIGFSWVVFPSVNAWLELFKLDLASFMYYGVVPGLIVVVFDVILMLIVSKKYYDDGGINERLFRTKNIGEIFFLVLLVSVSEEILFRGVVQTVFGYVTASGIFVLVHFRYLKKPVLLISIFFVSFYIGDRKSVV